MAVSEANSTADDFTHYVSIDFGTSGCGIAMAIKGEKSEIQVFSSWEEISEGVEMKCPTVLLLDPDKNFEQFGMKALNAMETKSKLKQPDKADDYLLFQKFKMCLYDDPVSIIVNIFYINGFNDSARLDLVLSPAPFSGFLEA